MKTVIKRSILFSLIIIAVAYGARIFLKTDVFLSDVGGLSSFVSAFATLYGILMAFIVVETWGQYNRTVNLINLEGQGLERLFRLTLYFRDQKLTDQMKRVIRDYAEQIIKGKFQTLGSGTRNAENGVLFRKIASVIREIKFDDDHDQIVFDQILTHYGHLGEVRTDRIDQSLERLPILMKVFMYLSSLFMLCTFIFMPFANPLYQVFVVAALGFVLAMVVQLIEDLDNPFVGNWNVTPEPFERTLKHIEEDYS